MKVDTSDHSDEQGGGKVVPAGTYTLRIAELSSGLVQSESAKHYGERKVDAKFSVVSDDEEHDGHTVFDVFTLVDSQMRKLKQFLRAAGYEAQQVNLIVDEDEDEESDDPEVENVYLEDLRAIDVQAKLKVRPGNREYPKKNEVNRYIASE